MKANREEQASQSQNKGIINIQGGRLKSVGPTGSRPRRLEQEPGEEDGIYEESEL